jgi:hypothetical protein
VIKDFMATNPDWGGGKYVDYYILDKLFSQGLPRLHSDITSDIQAAIDKSTVDTQNYISNMIGGILSNLPWTDIAKAAGLLSGVTFAQQGIPYVPKTMLAILHEGERVLTKKETAALTSPIANMTTSNLVTTNAPKQENKEFNIYPKFETVVHDKIDIDSLGEKLEEKFMRKLVQDLRSL